MLIGDPSQMLITAYPTEGYSVAMDVRTGQGLRAEPERLPGLEARGTKKQRMEQAGCSRRGFLQPWTHRAVLDQKEGVTAVVVPGRSREPEQSGTIRKRVVGSGSRFELSARAAPRSQ